MKPLRYIGYVRKSTEDEEKQVLSKQAQADKIRQQFSELSIVDILDESKSAFEPDKRPVFSKILKMIDSGEVDGIVAWHPDRLSRNEVDASSITWRIRQGKIKDLKFASFSFDNSPEGLMMLQMTMSQSQYFSAKLSKDVKRGNEIKRKQGGITGTAPAGYINNPLTKPRSVEIDPERFPLVRKAFDMYLTGEYSVQAVLKALNDDWGYKSIKRSKLGGTKLSRGALYSIFRNPRYAGWIPDPYENEKFYKANFPAMITMEEYDKVQDLLGKKGKPRLCASKQFVLKGFIRCGECGCMITAEHKARKLVSGSTNNHIYYHCTRKRPCKQKINVKEEDLFEQLKQLMNKYELTPKLYDWGIKALQELAEGEIKERTATQSMQNKTIESIQSQLDNLLDLVARGVVTSDDYKKKSESLKAELFEKQAEQADTASRTKNWYEFVGGTLQTLTYANQKFADGDLADKKEILLAIGQNPVILDGKLEITPNFWLNPVEKNLKTIREQLEKVRTLPQQIQKASEEAVRLQWYTVVREVQTAINSSQSGLAQQAT